MRKPFIAIFFSFLLAVLLGCGKSTEEIISTPELKPPGNSATPNYNPVDFSTDKAIYQPQEVVTFTIDNSSLPENVRVRYKHLNEVLEETTIPGAIWNWQPPETDFQGYLAEVYAVSDGMETIYATVGIDVSSDWAKFPRYGFLSKFSQMSDSEINAVIEKT